MHGYFDYNDETVIRPSYLYNENIYAGKTAAVYIKTAPVIAGLDRKMWPIWYRAAMVASACILQIRTQRGIWNCHLIIKTIYFKEDSLEIVILYVADVWLFREDLG